MKDGGGDAEGVGLCSRHVWACEVSLRSRWVPSGVRSQCWDGLGAEAVRYMFVEAVWR